MEPTETISAPPETTTSRGGVFVRLWRALLELFAILRADRLTWFAGLSGAITLTVSRYHFSTGEYNRLVTERIREYGGLFAWAARSMGLERLGRWLHHTTGSQAEYIYWFTSSFVLYFVVPLTIAAFIPKVKWRELGVGFGDWRYGLKATGLLFAVMLPFVVGASFFQPFQEQYPMSKSAAGSWGSLLVYEAAYCFYFISWEFIFRGVLCVGLYPRLGAAAILLQAIPFGIMHAGKPELETYGSIVAGIALGAMAVRTRSFWYGMLLHALVAMTMDALSLTQTHRWPQVW